MKPIKLKAARVNADLTIKKAAKILGVSEGTLIKWEKNPSTISAYYQSKIAEAYDFSIDDIIFLP